MPIKQIVCCGTPYEIGFTHGRSAADEIQRAIDFYAKLFVKRSGLSWPQVLELASEFNTLIKTKWPRYYEELRGIADGSGRGIDNIIALNVRTEIVFGQFSDGCTSLYYQGGGKAYLGQNWDWMDEQAANLIQLTIIQDSLPTIKIIAEAGMIGKIGLNSSGVGVCYNAIRARGLDKTRLPVHLGLRVALESRSASEAIAALEQVGMASPGHILIGDATTAVGLEFTSSTFAHVPITDGVVLHSNHMLMPHANIYESVFLEDSPVRLQTMERNIRAQSGALSWDAYGSLFEDESHYPTGINRAACGNSDLATLFNIVMDLQTPSAVVRMGRPVAGNRDGERVVLSF